MWNYRIMKRNEMNQDPSEGEFFAPEEGYPAALAREAIQNILDSRAGKDPARARFAFGRLTGEGDTLSSSPYVRDLIPHLQALNAPQRPGAGDEFTFLVVEDAGTRGLCGDEKQDSDKQQNDNEPKNDFYYFWRNVGRSQKGSTDRGRWGLGKTVFPASSRVLAFFGLTRRISDERKLLMGQFVGKIHEIAGQKYAAYGYYGAIEPDGFALPIDDSHATSAFESTFGLKRGEQPGLSVVIPYPQKELTSESLLREVIRNYYLPILFGDLIVEVQTLGGHVQTIDETSVTGLAATLGPEMQQTIEFASEVLSTPDNQRIQLKSMASNDAPGWGPATFDGIDLGVVRAQFERGDLVSLRVPVRVTPIETGIQTNSYFDVYLKRDTRLDRGQGDFVRQGLTITRIDRPPKGPVRGLLLVVDRPLSTLLGDSEGPAHTRWEERRERVKRYRHGSSTVRFVSSALRAISEQLAQQPAGVDEEALLDVFFLPEPQDADGTTLVPKRPGRKVTPPVRVPPIVARPKRYSLTQVKGGFSVIGTSNGDTPEIIRVSVAYETEDGNAQKSYNAFDFELDQAPIEITVTGAGYKASRNVLEIVPTSPDFRVEVSGFDVNRDLDVNAKP